MRNLTNNNSIWNRKAGGLVLALIIIAAYCGFKFARLKWVDDAFSWLSFLWYVLWFFAIVINALVADLFEPSDSWIFNSLKNIEQKNIPPEDKLERIRTQLQVAVDHYMSIFLMVNSFESLWKKIGSHLSRITKGKITVKELIVVCAYALWDLLLRGGELSIIAPYDAPVVFITLIALKVVDANRGFTLLISDMYKEAFKEDQDVNITLEKIAEYIKHLAHLYDIESTDAQITELTPAEKVETAILTINENVPLLTPENGETIRTSIAKRILSS